MTPQPAELRELSDPELITRWAVVRHRLALTDRETPERAEIKRLYDTLQAEYRRRMEGRR
jgi:hypothetical protein